MIIRADKAAVVVDEAVAVSGFHGEVLRRLPLAEAVLSLWEFLMDPVFLAGVFERHRRRSFEEVLTFPVLVELMADAPVQHRGSGRQAFERARQNDMLETSVEAMYGKLRRVPLSLSEGFLEEGTERLRELRSGCPVVAWPASLSEFTPVIVDGKKLKQVPKRRQVARGQPGKLYGGKLLVAYVPTEALVRAFHADRDGEAHDCKLMPGLIPRARQAIAGGRLSILDRQFCDLTQRACPDFCVRQNPPQRVVTISSGVGAGGPRRGPRSGSGRLSLSGSASSTSSRPREWPGRSASGRNRGWGIACGCG